MYNNLQYCERCYKIELDFANQRELKKLEAADYTNRENYITIYKSLENWFCNYCDLLSAECWLCELPELWMHKVYLSGYPFHRYVFDESIELCSECYDNDLFATNDDFYKVFPAKYVQVYKQ